MGAVDGERRSETVGVPDEESKGDRRETREEVHARGGTTDPSPV
jgi:hypothetical protein